MVGIRCVGLVLSCTFDLFMKGYDYTIVDGAVSHVGIGMIHSRGCSNQDSPYVVVLNEAMIYASENIWLYPSMFTCVPSYRVLLWGTNLLFHHSCNCKYNVMDCIQKNYYGKGDKLNLFFWFFILACETQRVLCKPLQFVFNNSDLFFCICDMIELECFSKRACSHH